MLYINLIPHEMNRRFTNGLHKRRTAGHRQTNLQQ